MVKYYYCLDNILWTSLVFRRGELGLSSVQREELVLSCLNVKDSDKTVVVHPSRSIYPNFRILSLLSHPDSSIHKNCLYMQLNFRHEFTLVLTPPLRDYLLNFLVNLCLCVILQTVSPETAMLLISNIICTQNSITHKNNVMLSLSYNTHHINRYTLAEAVQDLIASG